MIFNPKVTNAGESAAIIAGNTGFAVEITHIGFGTGNYDPTGAETALVDEIIRVPIAAGSKITPTQIRTSAVWESDVGTHNIREVGFWADTVLFAVYSTASMQPIAVKTPGIPLVFFYDLNLSSLPPDSVTVVADAGQSALLAALGLHTNDQNAHPQYLRRDGFADAQRLVWCGAAGGSANAITLTAPVETELPSYEAGVRFVFKSTAENTGPVTVNVNGLGLCDVVKSGGAALLAGEIPNNSVIELFFDGTSFYVVSGIGVGAMVVVTEKYTATAGQTNFLIDYPLGTLVLAYRDGERIPDDRMDATSGTMVVLLDAATAGEIIYIEALPKVSIADVVDLTSSQTIPAEKTFNNIKVAARPKTDTRTNPEAASTGFVKGLLGSIGDGRTLTAATTLVASDINTMVIAGSGTGPYTITAMPSVLMQDGEAVEIFAKATPITVAAGGADTFQVSSLAVTSIVLGGGDHLRLVKKGGKFYADGPYVRAAALANATQQATETIRGTAEVATQAEIEAGLDDGAFVTSKKVRFGFALSVSAGYGYIRLPKWLGSFIFQWGTISGTANQLGSQFYHTSAIGWTYPIAFPTGVFAVWGTPYWGGYVPSCAIVSATMINSSWVLSQGGSGGMTARVFAIGR